MNFSVNENVSDSSFWDHLPHGSLDDLVRMFLLHLFKGDLMEPSCISSMVSVDFNLSLLSCHIDIACIHNDYIVSIL
jgi:hypothetical protein